MIEYIYFVKCPNCDDEPFDFFDEAKDFAMGCLSQKPIITQVEVNRNDFGECTDSNDLGTIWSWEDLMTDVVKEPKLSTFSKSDTVDCSDYDTEFDDLDNSLDYVPDNFSKPNLKAINELEEGIFDSKEKKQKGYTELIKNIFGKDINVVVNEAVSSASDLLQEVADTFGEDDSSKNFANSIIKTIKSAKATMSKTPQSLVKNIVAIGQKYQRDSVNLEELKTFISNVGKLQTANKDGYKAMEFLFDKLNKTLSTRIDSTINVLVREFGLIKESKVASVRKPVPAGMTIEALVEEMEENEDTVECKWCNELFDKSECRYEVDMGWLCDHCVAAIKSRGEELTFREGLKEAFNPKEIIELEYNNLTITVQSAKYDVDAWDEKEITDSYTYKVFKDDVATAIWENFITEEDVIDVPGGLDTLMDDKLWYSYLETHFDSLFDKYYKEILEYFKDDAAEDFASDYGWDEYQDDLASQRADYEYNNWRDSRFFDESLTKKTSMLEELEESDNYRQRLTACPECGTESYDIETGICINCGFECYE